MTPYIEEAERLLWLAARDYGTFSILAGHPGADSAAAGFHAQQCAEKAIKAVLALIGSDFPRTHDLESLARLLGDRGFAVPVAPRDLRRLNPYAVEFRYDEQPPELVTLAEADAFASAVMRWAEALVADARLGSAADDGD